MPLLEYAGVSLAVLCWRERKAELVLLFAACQALAVASTFYDVRAAEWKGVVKARKEAVTLLESEREARSLEIDGKRNALDARLAKVQAEAAEARRQIASLALAPVAKVRAGDDSAWLLENERGQRLAGALKPLQETVAEDVRLSGEIRAQIAALDVPAREPGPADLPGTSAPTALAYVGETPFAGGSLAALLLALLFPTTVLAMGRVIAAGEAPSGPAASVDLRRELDEGAALSADRHDAYAALLEPVLAAHLASLRATRGAAARGLGLHLDLAADLDVLESVADLRGQVEGSGLSAPARERLAKYLDGLLTAGLAPPAETSAA